MDEKQRELYKLYEEHEREKTQTQQEMHNIASEKERLSKKSQELDEKERNLQELQATLNEKESDLSKKDETIKTTERAQNQKSSKIRSIRIQLASERKKLEQEKKSFSKLVESKRFGTGTNRIAKTEEEQKTPAPKEEDIVNMRVEIEREVR